jgi:TRAP-type mannitol/chloroaromatic compound transport system substrate-binding protein
MTDGEQAIIKAACESTNHTSLGEFTYQNSVYLDILTRDHGVQLRSFPDEVVTAMSEASRDVRASSGRDGIEKRIYESFETGLKKMSQWADVSDGPYYAARKLGQAAGG